MIQITADHPEAAQHDLSSVRVMNYGGSVISEAVHAVVVLKPGDNQPMADELVGHCHGLIAGYKCPRSVEFREALPMTGAGKVQKTELRKPHWEGRARAVN